jgi:hypothetical protein
MTYGVELQTLYEDMDIATLKIMKRFNWIGHISWLDDTRKVEQMFSSQPGGVRRRG